MIDQIAQIVRDKRLGSKHQVEVIDMLLHGHTGTEGQQIDAEMRSVGRAEEAGTQTETEDPEDTEIQTEAGDLKDTGIQKIGEEVGTQREAGHPEDMGTSDPATQTGYGTNTDNGQMVAQLPPSTCK